MGMLELYATEEVTVRTHVKDQWGSPQGAPVDVVHATRIERAFKRITDPAGAEVVSSARLSLPFLPATDAEIIFDGRSHKMVGMSNPKDLSFGFYWVYVA